MAIVVSVVRNDLDVAASLDDVLRRALDGETDWAKLSPNVWKAEYPKSIRVYRQDERRQAADRKKQCRARNLVTTSVNPSRRLVLVCGYVTW